MCAAFRSSAADIEGLRATIAKQEAQLDRQEQIIASLQGNDGDDVEDAANESSPSAPEPQQGASDDELGEQ
jgi:outer membrane protein TolC